MTEEPRSEPGHGTPEGYTSEEPGVEELGQPGTPGGGMDAHTTLSDDDHGHAEPVLGPIDWAMWSYALIGTAAALIVVALFAFAIS